MTDRRHFFKQAGLLALSPLPRIGPFSPQQTTGITRKLTDTHPGPVLLENAEMRLTIGSHGMPTSLLHKKSGQECLAVGAHVPMFTVTQYRPYDNELQLSYSAKTTVFPADSVRLDGDRLIVSFALVGYEATIKVHITDAYIGFALETLRYKGYTSLRPKRQTPIDECVFFQLPIRNRQHFGEWLNVMWDGEVAVNVLGTDHYARIDAVQCGDYHLLRAGVVDSIKTEGVGGALITTATDTLLDRIAQLEEDYGLPRGVESRRSKVYKHSYYELLSTTPAEIDRHINYARAGGFRTLDIYYRAFAKTSGHFLLRPEYPNGIEDVKQVVSKITHAGILPGIHIHYNKADKQDEYVTPVPDPRLSLRNSFTLRDPLSSSSTTINIEEDPRQCTLDKDRRFLKIQNELITYERFTTTPPYQFLNCQRGALGTQPGSYGASCRVGLLDVDTWPLFVRFTQNTGIQEEVAGRLSDLYRAAGFKFVYFDGAEDVPGPEYWYTVSRPQWIVYKSLDPPPLFAEGACKSHFSWHILTRGNAFDVFKPEVFKAAIRAYPASEAPQVARDFTSINFGWIGYWAPSGETIGTQPDMIEYATSRAAAWDCPISLVGNLEELDAHPRTPDNLKTIKKWEDVRATNWLTEKQKTMLRNLEQEHTLIVDEHGAFELVPYAQIPNVAGSDRPARAFIFRRANKTYVVFWHTAGAAQLEVPLRGSDIQLMAELGKPRDMTRKGAGITIPIEGRLYLDCGDLPRDRVISAFQRARIIPK